MGACLTSQGDKKQPVQNKVGPSSDKAGEDVEELNKENEKENSEDVETVDKQRKSPTPEPEVVPSVDEEEEVTDDDIDGETDGHSEFVFLKEHINDEVDITPPPLDGYLSPKPLSPSKYKSGTKVSFYKDWNPQIKEESLAGIHDRVSSNGSRPLTTITTHNIRLNVDQEEIPIQEVDKMARHVPKSVLKSFPDLIQYLTGKLHNAYQREMLTARALIIWLGAQDILEMTDGTGNEDTPEGLLVLLGQKKTTYSTVFAVLCREAGIMCIQIKGIAKCGSYVPGDDDVTGLNCTWNAVHIDGQWKIVHPYWACVKLYGNYLGGWVKSHDQFLESHTRSKSSNRILPNAFKEYFFLTDPYEFLHFCYPDDKKWQLTDKHISLEEFLDLPNLLPPFFALGLKLKSDKKCVLKTSSGSVSVDIEALLNNVNLINMWYELSTWDKTSDTEDEDSVFSSLNVPKLVTMIRNGTEWSFNIQFPLEGTFRLRLYAGPHNSSLLKVSEFKIECESPKKQCFLLPFNPGIVGFGPGPTTEEAGLYVPSHKNGLINTELKSEIKLLFYIDADFLDTLMVKSELININTGQATRVKCDIQRKTKILKIITSVYRHGDYSLTIATGTRTGYILSDKDVEDYRNVCNYFITTTHIVKHEKTNQRNARKALEDIYEDEDIDRLKTTIDKCIKERIDINDDQIVAALNRLEFLKTKKVLRDAYLRKNTEVVLKAFEFVEQSPYKGVLKAEIAALKRLKRKLKGKGAFTQRVPELHESLQELEYKRDPKPETYHTLYALFILLGEPDRRITCWGDIARLIHPPGKNVHTALHRMREIEEGRKSINIHNARKADRLLHKHHIDDVRHINMAAATIYRWMEVVLRTCFEIHEGSYSIEATTSNEDTYHTYHTESTQNINGNDGTEDIEHIIQTQDIEERNDITEDIEHIIQTQDIVECHSIEDDEYLTDTKTYDENHSIEDTPRSITNHTE